MNNETYLLMDLIPDNVARNIFVTQLRKYCKTEFKDITMLHKGKNGREVYKNMLIIDKKSLIFNCKQYLSLVKNGKTTKLSRSCVATCNSILIKFED